MLLFCVCEWRESWRRVKHFAKGGRESWRRVKHFAKGGRESWRRVKHFAKGRRESWRRVKHFAKGAAKSFEGRLAQILAKKIQNKSHFYRRPIN